MTSFEQRSSDADRRVLSCLQDAKTTEARRVTIWDEIDYILRAESPFFEVTCRMDGTQEQAGLAEYSTWLLLRNFAPHLLKRLRVTSIYGAVAAQMEIALKHLEISQYLLGDGFGLIRDVSKMKAGNSSNLRYCVAIGARRLLSEEFDYEYGSSSDLDLLVGDRRSAVRSSWRASDN